MRLIGTLEKIWRRIALTVTIIGLAVTAWACATYTDRYECHGLGGAYWKERCLKWPGSDEWDLSNPCCLYLSQFYRPKGL